MHRGFHYIFVAGFLVFGINQQFKILFIQDSLFCSYLLVNSSCDFRPFCFFNPLLESTLCEKFADLILFLFIFFSLVLLLKLFDRMKLKVLSCRVSLQLWLG